MFYFCSVGVHEPFFTSNLKLIPLGIISQNLRRTWLNVLILPIKENFSMSKVSFVMERY